MRLKPFNVRKGVRRQLRGCLKRFLTPSDLVCDIGCGVRPFSTLLSRVAGSHIGIDRIDGFYNSDSVDIAGTPPLSP